MVKTKLFPFFSCRQSNTKVVYLSNTEQMLYLVYCVKLSVLCFLIHMIDIIRIFMCAEVIVMNLSIMFIAGYDGYQIYLHI